MRAFLLRATDQPPELADVPEPIASGDNQMVVRVLAAGLNPVDALMALRAEGNVVPRVLGQEAVVDVGGKAFYVERAVAPHGSYAERCVTMRSDLVPLPDGLEPARAIPLGIAGLAGWAPIETTGALRPGETVVVLGATSTSGQVALQAARLLGAGRIVAVGRNIELLERLRGRGADAIVVLGGDVKAAIAEAAPGGADLIYDALFGPPLAAALASAKPGARSVSIGNMASFTVELSFFDIIGKNLLTYTNRGVSFALKRKALTTMMNYVLAGDLVVEHEVVRLADMASAWERQNRREGGKMVMVP